MLLVQTKLAPSQIHGTGLVADQFIPKGTIVWMHEDSIDRVYLAEGLNSLPIRARQFIHTYGWREGKYYILPGDNARFVNHSKEPNCAIDGKGQSYAIRDIQVGEEITEGYDAFDEDFSLYSDTFTAH